MIKLIEKIIDYIFQDNTNLFMIGGGMIIFGLFIAIFADGAYQQKLNHDLKLAKIAAGQVVDIDCGNKSR